MAAHDIRPDDELLVGRERELRHLDDALGRAINGRGDLVLLTGEPGIGKTALARGLVRSAQDAGAAWVWGTCWDGGGAPAYWPWTQVLRGIAREDGFDELLTGIGDGATWIAGLLPELADRHSPPPEATELDSDHARFRLFDALAGLLAAAARRRPLVVILDDLHWSDASSLFALEFVARTLPDASALVIACYRHGEAHERAELAQALGGLARIGSRLPLQGLDAGGVGLLLARRAQEHAARPTDTPAALVEAVHQATAGNPFFADELAQVLAAQGRLSDPDGDPRPLPLPDGVRDAIRRRLIPLGAAAIEGLEAAAVIGGGFRLITLAAVLGVPPGEALELLEEPLRAGLLIAGEDPGRYAFAHALVRATLIEELGTMRRARLHRAVGEALERLYADDPAPRLSELAHHFLAAAADTGDEQGVVYAERAARRAAETFAYDVAARLYQQALAGADALPLDEDRGWRLTYGLGLSLMRAGDIDGARAAQAKAADHARRLRDPRRFARAALVDIVWGISPGHVEVEQAALLEEALAGMEDLESADEPERAADDALRALLRVRLAVALYWSPEAERRELLIDEALSIGRALADDPAADPVAAQRTLAFTLAQGFVATWGPETLAFGLPASREALQLCDRIGDAELASQIRSWRCSLLLELDDPLRADEEIETFSRLALRMGQPRAVMLDALHRSMRAHMRGDFAAAEHHTQDAIQRARHMHGSVGMTIAGAQAFCRLLDLGRWEQVEVEARQMAATVPGMRAWHCALTLGLAALGRSSEAHAELDRLAAADFTDLPGDLLWVVSLALLSQACAVLEDAERAQHLYRLLVPFEGRNVVLLETAYLGPVSRFLGLLAMTTGEHDRALGHLEDARASAARIGARPAAVLAALDAAQTLVRRAGPSDRERARTLVAGAAPEAERLGMVGATAQAEAVAGRLGDAAASPPPEPVAAVAVPRPGPAEVAAGTLSREGDVWSLGYGGRTLRLQDAKGLRQLAVLLAHPGTEIAATALAAAGPDGAPPAISSPPEPPDLDELRERVAGIQAEIEEAEAFNDPERANRARDELTAIAAEFEAAASGDGADSTAPSAEAERARVNVTRAIRTAMRRIADHDPEVGRLLLTAVRTGARCSYEPDPYRPVQWHVTAE